MATTWAEWKTQKKAEYKDANGELLPPGIRHMLAFYGRKESTCEGCKYLAAVQLHPNKKQLTLRCQRYSLNKGKWDTQYPACGLKETFNEQAD